MSSKVAPFPIAKSAPVDSVSDERVSALATVIRTTLAPEEQELLLRQLTDLLGTPKASRAGDVLGTVVKLIPRNRLWTVAEVKQRIDEHGVAASAKEIYNAIGYLARKGRVKRVGYGRYMVDGVEFATLDDFGGANSHNEFEGR